VRHVEIFFDPQAHTQRGVPFSVVVGAIHRAVPHRRP
jgi:adenosine deaminase